MLFMPSANLKAGPRAPKYVSTAHFIDTARRSQGGPALPIHLQVLCSSIVTDGEMRMTRTLAAGTVGPRFINHSIRRRFASTQLADDFPPSLCPSLKYKESHRDSISPALKQEISTMIQNDNVHILPTDAARVTALNELNQTRQALMADVVRTQHLKEYRLDEYASRILEMIITTNAIEGAIILSAPSLIERMPKHAHQALCETVFGSLEAVCHNNYERYTKIIADHPRLKEDIREFLDPFTAQDVAETDIDFIRIEMEQIRKDCEWNLGHHVKDLSEFDYRIRAMSKNALLLTEPGILKLLSPTECHALMSSLGEALRPLLGRQKNYFCETFSQFG
jgi:hypothetical protein